VSGGEPAGPRRGRSRAVSKGKVSNILYCANIHTRAPCGVRAVSTGSSLNHLLLKRCEVAFRREVSIGRVGGVDGAVNCADDAARVVYGAMHSGHAQGRRTAAALRWPQAAIRRLN
jgi:hypothetical protein